MSVKNEIRSKVENAIERGATEICMYSKATSNQLLRWVQDEDGNFGDSDIDCMVDGAAEDTEDYELFAVIDGQSEAI